MFAKYHPFNNSMKYTSVIVALIVGVTLIVSTAIFSFAIKDAIKEYGRSLEKAAIHQPRPMDMPSRFTVSFEGGKNPLRFDVNSKP